MARVAATSALMYGALPTRPRLGLKPLPNCPISALDDGLIVAIFSYLKPNHLRFTAQDTVRPDGTVAEKGYRCSIDNTVRMGELVSYVSIVELIQCSMVCRQWRRCAQLRALWEEADLSKFRDAVNDDLVLRIAQKAGRRVRAARLGWRGMQTSAAAQHTRRSVGCARRDGMHLCSAIRGFWRPELQRCAVLTVRPSAPRPAHALPPPAEQLRSLCLNHCVRITDAAMYHLSTHCPLITELHIQGCTQLSAGAVLNLMRTLAYRNGLQRKPAVLSIELAKCAFLSPAVLEEIEKTLYTASRDAAATGSRRRARDEIGLELSRRTDERTAASVGASAPAAHSAALAKRVHDVAQHADQRCARARLLRVRLPGCACAWRGARLCRHWALTPPLACALDGMARPLLASARLCASTPQFDPTPVRPPARRCSRRWRGRFELDVGLCNLCNAVVDLSDGGRCSLCASVTCERCSDTPSTCELCCESFCNDCRLVRAAARQPKGRLMARLLPRSPPSPAPPLRRAGLQVATCVCCMKDYCDDCQEVLMCSQCDAVLCPECHAEHECPVETTESPAKAAPKPAPATPAPNAPAAEPQPARSCACCSAAGSPRGASEQQALLACAAGVGSQSLASGLQPAKHTVKRLPSAHRLNAHSSHSVEITASGSGSR